MKNDIDSSRLLLDKVLKISLFLFIVLPIVLFGYIKVGESKFVNNKDYYRIVTAEGHESALKLEVLRSPITNVENIKKWLRVSFLEVYSFNENNYNKKERWLKFKDVLSPSIMSNYWEKDLERISNLYSKSYNLTNAVISKEPLLLGKASTANGNKLWKFFIEITTENYGTTSAEPLYLKHSAIVIVEETNPSDKYEGVSIANITIK